MRRIVLFPYPRGTAQSLLGISGEQEGIRPCRALHELGEKLLPSSCLGGAEAAVLTGKLTITRAALEQCGKEKDDVSKGTEEAFPSPERAPTGAASDVA